VQKQHYDGLGMAGGFAETVREKNTAVKDNLKFKGEN